MKRLETILKKEVNQLEKIVAVAKNRLKSAPEGHLRVKKKRGGTEYYTGKKPLNTRMLDGMFRKLFLAEQVS